MSLIAPLWAWAGSYGSHLSEGISAAELWPADIVAKRCSFRLQTNRIRNASPLTRTTQIVDRPGKRWLATYEFLHVGNAFGRRMDALLVRSSSYLMYDHARPYPQKGLITGVTVAVAATRGTTQVGLTGLPASQTHLVAGDYLSISSRLYMVVWDVEANASGEATVTLNRGLLVDAGVGTEVNFNKPTCEMILQDDDQNDRSVQAGLAYPYVLSFVEPGVVVN